MLNVSLRRAYVAAQGTTQETKASDEKEDLEADMEQFLKDQAERESGVCGRLIASHLLACRVLLD